MKIFDFDLGLEPGKCKYKDVNFTELVKKFSPQKVTPYTVEFIDSDIDKSDAVVYDIDKKLDLVLVDLEKIEKRIERSQDEKEIALLNKCQSLLEEEKLLCDCEFSNEEGEILKVLQLVTYKPCVGGRPGADKNELAKNVIFKAQVLLFFTAGKKEVHAWSVEKGENILEAAGKIHSDLKRGFIKADIVNCKDLGSFFNMAEAKSKGLMKVVDRDYIVEENDIVEIRFNV